MPGSFGFVHFQTQYIWNFLCIYSADCIFLQSNPFDRKGVSWYTDGENQTFGGVLNAELYNPLTEREYLRSVGGFCAFRAVNNYCEVIVMKNFFIKHKRKFAFSYIVLTFVKFFTANIYLVREEDPTIYFKFSPTLFNTFLSGGDSSVYQQFYSEIYPWYANRQYWEIFHSPGGMQTIIEILYNSIIAAWWICSILLILYSLYKLFKNPAK